MPAAATSDGGVGVNEDPAPIIDPRFDPRFQRGYVHSGDGARSGSVPNASAESEAPVSSDTPAKNDLVLEPPVVERVQPSQGNPVARAESPAPTVVPPVVDPEGPAAGPSPHAPVAGPDTVPERDDGPSPRDPWFLAAWGVAVAVVVVGSGLWWTALFNRDYLGPPPESDVWLEAIAWSSAPALAQAGLIAMVGLLVWTGVRHARRHRDASNMTLRLLRNPSAVALALFGVIAVVVTIWAIRTLAEDQPLGWIGAPTEEQLVEFRVFSFANAIAAPATSVAVLSLIGVLVIAAVSGHAQKSARGIRKDDRVSAPRAR